MTSVRKSYTFQSLLKNITLLPAGSSADSFIKTNLWLQDWNFFSIQICVFNCNNVISCETVWVKVLLSKWWIVAVWNYSKSTIMEKNRGDGDRVNDNEFSELTQLPHFSPAYQQNICTSAPSPRIWLTTKQT